MNQPEFSLRDLSFYAGDKIFLRGQHLSKSGGVKNVTENKKFYDGKVKGSTGFYEVFIHSKDVERSDCDCYMGQNQKFCKHIVALGIEVFKLSKKLEHSAEKLTDLQSVKLAVNKGIRKLKPYVGPSARWFEYQRKLDAGSYIIEEAIQYLPASKENALYLWSLVLKLSEKLACDGIDDSDGRVGDCIHEITEKCVSIIQKEKSLLPLVQKFKKDDTAFGFEDIWKDFSQKN